MSESNGSTAEKALPANQAAALRRSVLGSETGDNVPVAPGTLGLVYFTAGVADEIRPWGTNPTFRDRQLREFLPMENFTLSAIGTVAARNMAFSWKLDGPPSVVPRVQDILESADEGRGWQSLIGKTSLDLYTQDKGAVWELVREADSENAPVIGLNHLDAQRIWHTRNLEYPVLYQNDKGKWIALRWYQVIKITEMPAPHRLYTGLQYSALTRVLRMAQVFRNIATYFDEKTGGRSMRSINIVSNVKEQAIRDAVERKRLLADNQGLTRYMDPVIVETFDPEQVPSLVTLDFASIPDGFKLEEMNKWYLTAIAMGLLEDYQTFAPLPGGGLGTATQSQTLHAKARGKGPGLWQKITTRAMNFGGVMPQNVTFSYDEQDIEEEQAEAELRFRRAQARQIMIANGEVDAAGARQLALDVGDIPQELFDQMNQQDLTRDPARDSMRTANDDEDVAQKARLPVPQRAGPDEERLALEAEIAGKLGEGFARVRDSIERRLGGEKSSQRRAFLSVDLSGIEDSLYDAQLATGRIVQEAVSKNGRIVEDAVTLLGRGMVALNDRQEESAEEIQQRLDAGLDSVALAVDRQTAQLDRKTTQLVEQVVEQGKKNAAAVQEVATEIRKPRRFKVNKEVIRDGENRLAGSRETHEEIR